jgi:serine/threonine-protein kinase
MELIKGKTLKEIIIEDGILSWKWSVSIAIQIASALETAHKNNIIHRDIKPHNIIITEDGIAKVTDFGIAKAVSNSTITAFGTTIGSVHYFSPEHARGGYTDAKSDLYSLGIVMYEMLTGRVPFDADTPVSVALKQVQEEPVEAIKYNSSIPVSVNRIILKAMQKDPNLRYQNATEMLKDLSMALKKPNEDFVVLVSKSDDSPTQKVPTLYELEMEKHNERKAPRTNREETKKGKFEKIKEYYQKHPMIKVLTFMILALVLFIGVMFGTITFLKSKRPAQEAMPNLAGYKNEQRLTKEEATKKLNELGFTNIKYEEEYHDEAESGYVIRQKPEFKDSGYRINVTEEIILTISKGQKMVTLPKKLVGKKLEDVQKSLDDLELKYEIIEENSEKVEAGIVIKVEPEEGEEITAATPVNITVSKGSALKDIVVPNVLNNSEADARNKLAGLNITVNTEEHADKSDGVVISQSIVAGKTIKEGENITIVVNKQPKTSRVTVNVNLKSLTGYQVPEDTIENVVDANGVVTGTTVKPAEIKTAEVVIKVGEETIYKGNPKLTETNISASYSGTGVKEIKVLVDGVTKDSGKKVDFNQGDKTINIP